jgi:hypothetical protein
MGFDLNPIAKLPKLSTEPAPWRIAEMPHL